ncbi:hypothetical protein CC117_30900 [Parafrankia colletiae]|uniref:Uncharacterized protein n=1 Tax=Parafrankia colletiae TaxID=573497 RepID=A0A1S1Q2N3_9ACTN|nr:hypothetical protein [Parafrankia colletiae]MCK9904547.1 hypothetical protein [Frankia sp. Cpl3]OHV27837.1 hypothetical protein CC117_30900 [Parafrankia colletiae]
MDEALLRTVVEAQLGRHHSWKFYDRRKPTYLNLVLAHAERRANRPVNLVWVEGGFPELFTLQGGGVTVPVFSTRYVEMSGVLRKTLSNDYSDAALRREQAEYATLRLIGEMALRLGHADLAARCLALSVLERQIWIPDLGYNDYEMPPYDEGYAAHWYFAILHEIGHSVPSPNAGLVADGIMRAAVEVAGLDPDHVHRSLQPAELRAEVVADMFAASMLLETTMLIMEDRGEDFDPLVFMGECLLTAAVVELVERCRRFVLDPAPDAAAVGGIALHIREIFLRGQIIDDLRALFGPEGPPEQVIAGALIEIHDAYVAPALRDIAPGVAAAMSQARAAEPSTTAILARLRAETTGPDPSVGQQFELRRLNEPLRLSPTTSPLLSELADLAQAAPSWLDTITGPGPDPGSSTTSR